MDVYCRLYCAAKAITESLKVTHNLGIYTNRMFLFSDLRLKENYD